MESKFFIDRQFGQPIFIDVTDGIVTKVYNDSQLQKKMNEVYVGKEISFLKTDFEERKKGTYHCVKSLDLVDQLQKISGIDSQINSLYAYVRRQSHGDFDKVAIEEQRLTMKHLEESLVQAKKDADEVRVILKKVHRFNF